MAPLDLLLLYHIIEEIGIAFCCLLIGSRIFRLPTEGREQQRRGRLMASGFILLGVSGLIHAGVHQFHLDRNLLYQTLLGYCFSLLLVITAITAERTRNKILLPLGYLPLLFFLHPALFQQLPPFNEFRPLTWIAVSYLSGVVAILFYAVLHRTGDRSALWPMIGFLLISTSSAFLFFPAAIGSTAWFGGHLLRPIGFILLAVFLRPAHLRSMGTSILYRALGAFSLLAAIPFFTFGTLIFYENITPFSLANQRGIVFLLLLITLSSSLAFGLGMILRLIRPILQLKDSVEHLTHHDRETKIPILAHDEIGELAHSFRHMLSRLRNAIEEQERLCRMAATGELAATLAHEIKNPLNAIGGATSYLKRNFKGTLPQEFLQIIGDEVSRINQLASSLLSFARPQTPVLKHQDINRLVGDTLLLLQTEFTDHAISLHQRLSPDLPSCPCDANQIKQVLLNLLLNAMDAMPGGGDLTVTTRACRRLMALRVRDSGAGISMQIQREIFNPFFTTKTRGTGLGLAIARTIAREHGGNLWVVSRPPHGTTFTLTLPLEETK